MQEQRPVLQDIFADALRHHQSGRLGMAEPLYRQVLEKEPRHLDSLHLLGVLAQQTGRNEMAVALIAEAIGQDGLVPDFHSNLGHALQAQGKHEMAALSCRRATILGPDFDQAYNNLGVALQALGRAEQAEIAYGRGAKLRPDWAEAHFNRGNALLDGDKPEEAMAAYRQALACNAGYAEAHCNLGNVMQRLGRPEEAMASYRQALICKPDHAIAHNNLGNALQDQGRLDEALLSCKRALSLKPDWAEAQNNLGNALKEQGRLDAAAAAYRQAIESNPDLAEAHNNLGNALKDQGRPDIAMTCYRQALRLRPSYAEAYDNLLFLCAGREEENKADYLDLARGWELACLPQPIRAEARTRFAAWRQTAGRLRIGYVSGDFRQHAVSFFLEPILAHHDRRRVEIFAYTTTARQDMMTERLRSLTDHWISLVGLSDESACRRIEDDGIDVLVDLSGHTKGNRLGVFARRAAPVQIHYLGFFASTGLSEMDYWIGDSHLTPIANDADFSETVWRLPRIWVSYDGKAEAPETVWRPSADGSIWLGGFNRLEKITPRCLALWARLLAALPEGRLLLKTRELADPELRRRLLASFKDYGVDAERIELQDRRVTPDWASHMAYYDRLDIALDPVGGMGGGTTTCDALWMGVPVIGLEGRTMATRMTGAMLAAVGQPDWLAQDEDAYIAKAVALAHDVELRRSLRPGQRARMAASALCDSRGLANALEDAFSAMLQRRDNSGAERLI